MMPAHQVRSTGADAKTTHRFGGCPGDARIRCKAQVIIAAEGQIVAAIDPDLRALGGLQQAPVLRTW